MSCPSEQPPSGCPSQLQRGKVSSYDVLRSSRSWFRYHPESAADLPSPTPSPSVSSSSSLSAPQTLYRHLYITAPHGSSRCVHIRPVVHRNREARMMAGVCLYHLASPRLPHLPLHTSCHQSPARSSPHRASPAIAQECGVSMSLSSM